MELLQEWGYIGLFIGSFLAATVIPFSSDILLIGILLAGGSPVASLVVATSGNWLGGLTSYWLGYLGKWEWIEKWFGVSEEKIMKHKHRIDRYGSLLALMSWLPFVGDIFAIGLGFFRTSFWKSAAFMLIGKGARFFFWVLLFLKFGERISEFSLF